MKGPRSCKMSGTAHPTTQHFLSNSAVRGNLICCTVVQLLLGYGEMLMCVSMITMCFNMLRYVLTCYILC